MCTQSWSQENVFCSITAVMQYNCNGCWWFYCKFQFKFYTEDGLNSLLIYPIRDTEYWIWKFELGYKLYMHPIGSMVIGTQIMNRSFRSIYRFVSLGRNVPIGSFIKSTWLYVDPHCQQGRRIKVWGKYHRIS